MTPDAVTDSLPNKSGEGQAHSGVNRKLSRKTPRFSLMVAGRAGIGKTTLLATLFNPFLDPTTIPVEEPLIDLGKVFSQTKTISTYSFEVELSDTRLIIEACDTPGYDDGSLTPSKLTEMLRKHIESAYNEVFEEEQRIRRNPKFEEHRVHVLLYLIDGCSRDGVRDLDLSVMRGLHDRVNIVPILAKGDSYDLAERALMKQKINSALAAKQIRTFNMSSYINNTHSNSNIDQIKPCNSNRDEANPETVTIPFSIIGDSFFPPQVKNAIDPEKEKKTRGRSYPWGFADCDNQLHCDLVILQRVLLDSAWEELREETEDSLYEAYRTEKLLVTTDK